jgi:poly(ADP-ribose) glycohydrolase
MNRPYDWKSSTLRFMTNVQFIIEEPLQLAKKDTLVVDFANSFPGGGILMKGALQEEVLFCCYPELLVTRLVAERLDRDEVLLIHGVDKYNDMIGYGEKISIANNGPEQSPVGPDRRRRKQIVIMDALEFSGDNYQYGTTAIMRELNKVMN